MARIPNRILSVFFLLLGSKLQPEGSWTKTTDFGRPYLRKCLCVGMVDANSRCLWLLMKYSAGNYEKKHFPASDGTTEMMFWMKQLEGNHCASQCYTLCAPLWEEYVFLYVCWRTKTRLEANHRIEESLKIELRVRVVFWYVWRQTLATRRHILDCDDFGLGWCSWEVERVTGPGRGRLWLHVVQLGDRFWMEMSHTAAACGLWLCHPKPRHFTIFA